MPGLAEEECLLMETKHSSSFRQCITPQITDQLNNQRRAQLESEAVAKNAKLTHPGSCPSTGC